MNNDFFVQAKGISFSYPGRQRLLENISFNIAKGQCLGIRGPSGCGKSTLAQIIAGHLHPEGGEVFIDGKKVTGRPQRSVFLIPQETDLFPWLTVQRQIAFGMEKPEPNLVRDLIALTKLDGFQKYYPSELSGGMKKRLSIARALAVNPKLLIFDESFSSLDFDLRTEIFRDLKQIWQTTQTTILLISHDPRDLAEIAQEEIQLSKDKPTQVLRLADRR